MRARVKFAAKVMIRIVISIRVIIMAYPTGVSKLGSALGLSRAWPAGVVPSLPACVMSLP